MPALGAGATRRGVLAVLAGAAGFELREAAANGRRRRKSTQRVQAAAKPITTEEHLELTITYDCGSVVLVEPATIAIRTVVFVDRAGNPVRETTDIKLAGVITNPDTGQTVDDRAHITLGFDYVTGERTQTGNFVNLTVPGEGTVLQGVGRFTVDAGGEVLFSAGKHEATEFGNDLEPAICAALVG
jgi:hypothetical protein